MKLKYLLISIFYISTLFSISVDPNRYNEITFGRNYPTAIYDKYSDDGFSFKFVHSRAFDRKNDLREGLFRWQLGLQYISFRSNRWYDYFELGGGQGPSIEITNSEQGYVFNGGFRFIASNGLDSRGYFRPYASALIGMSFFSEKTLYHWGDDCTALDFFLDIILDDSDFCDNGNSETDINDRSWSPTFTLDLGTNIYFNDIQDVGMDVGVRYNMLTRLKTPHPDELQIENNSVVGNVSSFLQADYYTWYIGITWTINSFKKKRNKSKGRLI